MHHYNSVLLLQITICNDTDGEHNNGVITSIIISHPMHHYNSVMLLQSQFAMTLMVSITMERKYRVVVVHEGG